MIKISKQSLGTNFMESKNFKSGFVAILGRANVGKSTLLNFLLGEKISIVSSKPQTTRYTITGILNMEDAQIVLLDTPGLHNPKKQMNRIMMAQTQSVISDNNLVVYVTDVDKNNFEKDKNYLKQNKISNAILLINKVDLIKKEELLPLIEKYNSLGVFDEIIPISLKKLQNLENIVNIILKYLPCGPQYYPDDIISPDSEKFIVSEMIREKVFNLTHEEIPYSVAVTIDYFQEFDKLSKIGATIIVEKSSQKSILVGKNGDMIKKIGIAARKDIEKFLNKKIYLELFVKVVDNWTKDSDIVQDVISSKIT